MSSHRVARACVTTLSFLVLELIRQTTHVHAMVQRDLTAAGVKGIAADLFDIAPAATPIWLLWLGVLSASFLFVSNLYRERFGRSASAVARAATTAWLATFALTWLSFLAFGLTQIKTAAIALTGAWLESLVVAAIIIYWPTRKADGA